MAFNLLLASTSVTVYATVIGAFIALLGVAITMLRLPMDRQALYITSKQGAATILNDLVKNLSAEIERLNDRVEELEKELAEKNLLITKLQSNGGQENAH